MSVKYSVDIREKATGNTIYSIEKTDDHDKAWKIANEWNKNHTLSHDKVRFFADVYVIEEHKVKKGEKKVMYKFLTTKELAKAIAVAPFNTVFDFTFDSCEEDFYHGEPTGWHGTKITTIFGETSGVFVIGSYGSCGTRLYDLGMETNSTENIVTDIEDWLDSYCSECDYNFKLCVEITDENQKYFPQKNNYNVEVTEMLHKFFTIEAHNKKEAEDIVKNKLVANTIDPCTERIFKVKEIKDDVKN